MFTSRVVKRVETQTEGVTRKGENKHNSDSRERGPGPHSPAFVLQERALGKRGAGGAQLIFLLGVQVDKLATPFTAFFPLSPLYHKNC